MITTLDGALAYYLARETLTPLISLKAVELGMPSSFAIARPVSA